MKKEYELNFLNNIFCLGFCWFVINFNHNYDGFMGDFVLWSKTSLKIFISFLFIFILAYIGDKLKKSKAFVFFAQLLALLGAYYCIQILIFNLLK